MPRVEACSEEVSKWCESTGNGSATADVCLDCYNSDLEDTLDAQSLAGDNTHPKDVQWEEMGLPPEGYTGEDSYYCNCCDRTLTEEDE
jgi:hypothetical protein